MSFDPAIGTGQVPFFVRVTLGTTLVYYGLPKIRDLQSNAADFVDMGFKPGIVWGTLISGVEFLGGRALCLSVYPELVAALFGFQMLVGSFWKYKRGEPLDEYFYDVQLFGLCVVIMHFGGGDYVFRPFRPVTFLRWDVAGGALLLALILSHLPELLGERYRRWAAAAK